jgi:hypothetical protein
MRHERRVQGGFGTPMGRCVWPEIARLLRLGMRYMAGFIRHLGIDDP